MSLDFEFERDAPVTSEDFLKDKADEKRRRREEKPHNRDPDGCLCPGQRGNLRQRPHSALLIYRNRKIKLLPESGQQFFSQTKGIETFFVSQIQDIKVIAAFFI